jgi:hypothetical protein
MIRRRAIPIRTRQVIEIPVFLPNHGIRIPIRVRSHTIQIHTHRLDRLKTLLPLRMSKRPRQTVMSGARQQTHTGL